MTVASFLDTVGSTKDEWLKQGMVTKLSDLISYWGVDNILDNSADWNKEEISKKLGIK